MACGVKLLKINDRKRQIMFATDGLIWRRLILEEVFAYEKEILGK